MYYKLEKQVRFSREVRVEKPSWNSCLGVYDSNIEVICVIRP